MIKPDDVLSWKFYRYLIKTRPELLYDLHIKYKWPRNTLFEVFLGDYPPKFELMTDICDNLAIPMSSFFDGRNINIEEIEMKKINKPLESKVEIKAETTGELNQFHIKPPGAQPDPVYKNEEGKPLNEYLDNEKWKTFLGAERYIKEQPFIYGMKTDMENMLAQKIPLRYIHERIWEKIKRKYFTEPRHANIMPADANEFYQIYYKMIIGLI